MSKHKKTNQKSKYIIITIVVLLLAGVAGFLICQKILPQPSQEDNKNTFSISAEQSEPKLEQSSQDSKDDESGGKTPIQYEGENPNKAAELSGSINSARVTGDNLVIRVNIDQFLSNGTCDLTLASGDKKFTSSTDIEAMVSTSTCDGFSIPVSKLSSGKWNIKIKLSSGDKIGEITGEAEI